MPNVSPPAVNSNPIGGVGHPMLVGFSVRSLVEAVAALGWHPVAVDHFTDQDCRELAYAYFQVEKWGGKPPNFEHILVGNRTFSKFDANATHLQMPRADIRAEYSELGEKISPIEASIPAEPGVPEPISVPGLLRIPWVLLGGGTENWLELVANLHQNFKVLGPTTDQLAQLRNYKFWRQSVALTGICFPPTLNRPPNRRPPLHRRPTLHRRTTLRVVTPSPRRCTPFRVLPRSLHRRTTLRVVTLLPKLPPTSWLIKPTRSAGGHAIERLPRSVLSLRSGRHLSNQTSNAKNQSPKIYQKEISGRPLGAHCILSPKDVHLLGLTESFTNQLWPGPCEFIYRGSWGPIAVTDTQQAQITSLCRNIQAATGLLGWLQLDFIEDERGQLWLLELNPRWTAGMEILHLAGINPVAHHLAAWKFLPNHSVADGVSGVKRSTALTTKYGKAVIYADRDLHLSHENLARLHALPRKNFADLPASEMVGGIIGKGQPLLTVRTRVDADQGEQSTRVKLLQQLQQLRAIALASV